jgi:hypothetical protein
MNAATAVIKCSVRKARFNSSRFESRHYWRLIGRNHFPASVGSLPGRTPVVTLVLAVG